MRWKVIPCSRFDLRGRELFLEACAREGLRPLSLGTCLSRVEPGEAAEVRYRLEPFRERGGVPQTLVDCYQEAGWRYCFRGDAFAVFAAQDPETPEPYTDAESCGLAMDFLDGALKRYAWVRLLIAALLLAVLLWAGLARPRRGILLLLGLPLTAWLWLGLLPWQAVRDWKALRHLRDACAAGIWPEPGPSAKLANGAMVVLTGVLAAVMLAGGLAARQEPPIPADWPSLEELEVSYPVEHDYSAAEQGLGSLLAPRQRLFEEAALGPLVGSELGLPGVGWYEHGKTTQYHPHLEMAEWRVLPLLAKPVARGLMDQLQPVNLTFTNRELQVPGTDWALLAESDGVSQSLAMVRGTRLLVYHYYGAEQLTDHLEQLSRPLTD